MRRTLLVIILSALSLFILLLILNFLIKQVTQSQPATVYLKPNVVKEGDLRKGQVTRGEKYLIVDSPDHGQEVFSWDQIRYLSLDNPASNKLDKLIDSIDLLSKLGIVLTLALFVIGLYQYHQGQKWKREEFLVAAIKDFVDSKRSRNAKQMLESWALYRGGRKIELFPNAEGLEKQRVFVTNAEVFRALTIDPHEDLDRDDDRAMIIRECFDAFLTDLGTFYHYVEQDLITTRALAANISYWIELLGPEGELRPDYKRRVFAYAEKYGLIEIQGLIRKYHKEFEWKKDIPLVISFHSFSCYEKP